MLGLLFLFSIVYIGTYKVIQRSGWKEAIKVAVLSFVIAVVLTAVISMLVMPLVKGF